MYRIKRAQQLRCRHRWGVLALILTIVTPITSLATDVKLPIQFEQQEGSNWCGCACITAIVNRYMTDYPEFPVDPGADACDEIGQCAVVNRGHNLSNCCLSSNPCNSLACGVGGWVLERFLAQWGVDSKTIDDELSFEDYTREIDDGKPVVVHVEGGGSGHNMLGVGYNNDFGNEDMYIMDPADFSANGGIQYTSYQSVIDGSFSQSGGGVDRPWRKTVTMENSPTSETIRLRCTTHGKDYTYKSNTTNGRIIAGSDEGHEFKVVDGSSAVFEAKDRIVLKRGFHAENGSYFRARIVP